MSTTEEKDSAKNITSQIDDITADLWMVINGDQMTDMNLVGFHHRQDTETIYEHEGEIIWHNLVLK